MPDPTKYDTQDDWMEACVPVRMDEGDKQDQAVAACLNIWRNRNKARGEGQGVGGEPQGDGGADVCVCSECGKTVPHERGVPCATARCPDCGAVMEGKEVDEKATWTTAYVNDLPDSCFLYVESGDKDEGGKTVPRSKRHLPYKDAGGKVDLPHLRNAISRLGQPGTGGGWLSESLRQRLLSRAQRLLSGQKKSLFDKAVGRFKEILGIVEEPEPTHPFLVWKEQESGRWRWLAIYSNKWRDEDHPPEIISEAAHKEFVDAVDSGEWPMPELWLWHVRGTKSGAADLVTYDDQGFALACGTFDEECEPYAKTLSEMDDLLTSHGMPVGEIQREKEDPTIITRYRSVEISPLPSWAAANKHSGFYLLKEADMSLPEKKRPFLEQVMGTEGVADLERRLADKAKELEDQGIEYKEDGDEAAAPVAEAQAEPEPVVEAPVEEPPDYPTRDEVVEAFGAYVKPLHDRLDRITEAVEALGKEVKELKQTDEQKIEKALIETPAASLMDRIGSVIGTEATRLDGRTTLAKDAPAEISAPIDGPTFVPALNEYIARQRGG